MFKRKEKAKNSSPIKIVMSVTNDLVTDQRVNKVASTLTENNYSVIVIGRQLRNSVPLVETPYKCTRLKLLTSKSFLFYAEFNLRLFIKLLSSKADIFTANDLDTLPATFLAAKLMKKTIIYDSHEYFTEVPELVGHTFKKKTWEKIEAAIFPRLKYVSTVCESIADIYKNKYGVAISVIRNLPFKKAFIEAEKDQRFKGKKLIIYQGAVNIGRGIEKMIEAVKLLDDVVFLIIGGGDKEKELRLYVENEGLSNKIIFTGKLHYKELHAYTCQADLGMSLEENIGLNYYYALPNKLFDYIHSRVPLIASPLPEIKKIVEKYKIGIIDNSRSPEELALSIDNFFKSPDQSKYFKANAVKAAEVLCWENEKKALLDLYRLAIKTVKI